MKLSEIKQIADWSERHTTFRKTRIELAKSICDDKSFIDTYHRKYPDSWNTQFTIGEYRFGISMNEHTCRYVIRLGRPDYGKNSNVSYAVNEQWKNAVTEITVSGDKTPEQIKRDIEKRLIPQASELYRIYRESIDKYNQFVDSRELLTNELHSLCTSFERYHKTDSEREPVLHVGAKHEFYGDVTVHSDSSVTFELRSMPAEMAKQLCEAINRIVSGNAE